MIESLIAALFGLYIVYVFFPVVWEISIALITGGVGLVIVSGVMFLLAKIFLGD